MIIRAAIIDKLSLTVCSQENCQTTQTLVRKLELGYTAQNKNDDV
jgi:hypothetical protein